MVRSERVPARGYRSNERATRSGPACPYLSLDPPWLLPASACHVAALSCLTSENSDGGLAVEAGSRLTF
jgi:hypothetical protein